MCSVNTSRVKDRVDLEQRAELSPMSNGQVEAGGETSARFRVGTPAASGHEGGSRKDRMRHGPTHLHLSPGPWCGAFFCLHRRKP